MNACVTEDIRTCLAKDCSEMSVCLSKYGGEPEGEFKLDPSLKAEITAKVTACVKAQGGQKGGGATPQYPQSPAQKPACPVSQIASCPEGQERKQYTDADGLPLIRSVFLKLWPRNLLRSNSSSTTHNIVRNSNRHRAAVMSEHPARKTTIFVSSVSRINNEATCRKRKTV